MKSLKLVSRVAVLAVVLSLLIPTIAWAADAGIHTSSLYTEDQVRSKW